MHMTILRGRNASYLARSGGEQTRSRRVAERGKEARVMKEEEGEAEGEGWPNEKKKLREAGRDGGVGARVWMDEEQRWWNGWEATARCG